MPVPFEEWASGPTASRTEPTPTAQLQGFACGPADPNIFNQLFGWLSAEAIRNCQRVDDLESTSGSATQVAQNTTDIAALSTAVAGNDTDIAALSTTVAGNDTDIAALQTAVAGNDTELADHETRVTALESAPTAGGLVFNTFFSQTGAGSVTITGLQDPAIFRTLYRYTVLDENGGLRENGFIFRDTGGVWRIETQFNENAARAMTLVGGEPAWSHTNISGTFDSHIYVEAVFERVL